MRYFLTLAYRGTRYAGWQRQPNGRSVQEVLETALRTILRQPVALTGCGRTDAGVHARHYVAHLDVEQAPPVSWLNGLNSLLPEDIAVYTASPMPPGAHARYDAFERSYEYRIGFQKDPFALDTTWFYPQGRRLDVERMQAVAAVLLAYQAFFPFCRTHSGVKSYACSITRAQWLPEAGGQGLTFRISANRFLRGMVRLIVGACVQVGRGQLDLDAIRAALDAQCPLPRSLSAPPQGLALTEVKYPYPVVP